MRHLNVVAIATTCLLAGAAAQEGWNGLEPRFLVHEPHFRVACDNFMTVRPSDEQYWKAMRQAELPMHEAAERAVKILTRKKAGYDEAKVLRAELVLVGVPYYRVEVYARGTDEETGEPYVHRWHLNITMRGKAKAMVRKERLPGTLIRGEIETLPSGIMVYDALIGDGQAVQEDSTVRAHFMSLRLDGMLIESTYERQEPVVFDMKNPPVPGFEALVGARVGGKRKLVIPPEMAFGEDGVPPYIPPYCTLVYDVEVKNVR